MLEPKQMRPKCSIWPIFGLSRFQTLTNSILGCLQIWKWISSLNSHWVEVSKNVIGCQNQITQSHHMADLMKYSLIFQNFNVRGFFPTSKFSKWFWWNWNNFSCTFRRYITYRCVILTKSENWARKMQKMLIQHFFWFF